MKLWFETDSFTFRGLSMQPLHDYWFNLNRRQLLKSATAGGLAFLGSTALTTALGGRPTRCQCGTAQRSAGPSALRAESETSHLPLHGRCAVAARYLRLQTGSRGPVQQDLPPSVRGTQRLTGMTSRQARLPIAPSIFKFTRHPNAENGLWVSDLLRRTGEVADEFCVIKSMTTEQINHGPGITFMQTGHQIPGRPAIGAWLSYGLGSANHDLPSFVVMISQGRGQMQALFSHLWGAGFLPGEHQGVQFRAANDPVLFLNDPPGVRPRRSPQSPRYDRQN